MTLRYALLMGALLPALASAQEDQPLSLDYPGIFIVHEPASIAGVDSAGVPVGWADTLTLMHGGLRDVLVLTEPARACSPITNTDEIAGRIAFIARGECYFSLKAYHAQQAGAVGFVIRQHDPNNAITGTFGVINMAPADSAEAVTIPGLFISWARAEQVLGALPFGPVEVSLRAKYPVSGETSSPEVAGTHMLSAAYPNPFNPDTRFTLSVARTQQVSITLHDLLGRTVATIHQGHLAAGSPHEFSIDGSRLPSGTYLYRVVGETFSQTRRVTLLR